MKGMDDINDREAKKRRLEATQTLDTVAPSTVPGGEASQLDSAKDFILHIFMTWKGDSICWGKLSAEWKADPDIAMEALTSDDIAVSDLPACLRNDRNFMMEAVARHGRHWSSLPENFKSDPDFARAVTEFPRNLARSILEHLPRLCSDRAFWMKLIEADAFGLYELVKMKAPREICADRAFWMKLIEVDAYGLHKLVQMKAPREIRADRDVMMSACMCDTETFHFIDDSLWLDKDFVKRVLTSDEWKDSIIRFIPHETQYKWSDLIFESIWKNVKKYSGRRSREGWDHEAKSIGTDLWRKRDFVIGWFSNGGPFFANRFPEDWREDKEIFLLIAKHCHHSEVSFRSASQNLTSDKVFMLQVVELDCQLFFKASKELQQDFDFVVAALAGSKPLGDPSSMAHHLFLRDQGKNLEFVESVCTRVRSKLGARDVFVKVVLPGMSIGTGACHLTLLTEIGYKKIIAEYLGVPFGKEHELLRLASVNLPAPDLT